MRLWAIPLLSATLLATPACTKPPAAQTEEAVDETIVLLSEGSEPRRQLRYAVEVGQVETLRMTMAMEMRLGVGELPPQTQKLPLITVYSRASVEAVSGDQIIEKVEFDRHEVTPGEEPLQAQFAKVMGEELAKLDDYQQLLTMDSRGNIRSGSISLPPDLDPQVAQSLQNISRSLEQVLVTWPSKAVGVGGRWKRTQTLDNQGLEIEQTSESEIVRIDGDSVTLATKVSQTPLREQLALPNLPPGATAKLLEFESSGSGEIVYELGHPFPHSGKSTMTTKLVIEAAIGEQVQKVATEIELEVTLERVPQ